MLIFGGESDSGDTIDGAAFDRAREQWGPITGPETGGGPYMLAEPLAVWTGEELILLSGANHVSIDPESPVLGRRAAYDPEAGAWRFLGVGGPPIVWGSTAVWTGAEVILWGGTASGPSNTGSRYDPVQDIWSPTSTTGAPAARFGHVAVWTGVEMLVWGGNGSSWGGLASGGCYDPKADTWTDLPSSGAPPPAVEGSQVAVWTGSEMIVWGGGSSSGPTAEGSRFSPADRTWRPMSNAGAPAPRFDATGVWTGRELIIWGGVGPTGVLLRDGARYDPLADVWKPLPLDGAPSGAVGHSAVWTGTEMVVWGGMDATAIVGSGARFVPD